MLSKQSLDAYLTFCVNIEGEEEQNRVRSSEDELKKIREEGNTDISPFTKGKMGGC